MCSAFPEDASANSSLIEVSTLLRDPAGNLVPFESVQHLAGDLDHIAGVIMLTIQGTPLLTPDLWDDVDALWCYLLTICERCRNNGSADTYFPDQPIKIEFRADKSGRGIHVSVGGLPGGVRRAWAPKEDFFRVMLREGGRFLERMSELAPTNVVAYQTSLDLIRTWPLDGWA